MRPCYVFDKKRHNHNRHVQFLSTINSTLDSPFNFTPLSNIEASCTRTCLSIIDALFQIMLNKNKQTNKQPPMPPSLWVSKSGASTWPTPAKGERWGVYKHESNQAKFLHSMLFAMPFLKDKKKKKNGQTKPYMLLTLDVLIIIIIIGCCAMPGLENRSRKDKGTRGELTLKPGG